MTVTKCKKERAVIFSTLEDFEKHVTKQGLPSELLGTISQAYE